MPKEPRDRKRPSDVIGNAVRIAGTGETEETSYKQPAKLTDEERGEIAKLATEVWWKR